MNSTAHDYADMVNPYVRAEREAYERGYRKALLHAACWFAALAIVLALTA